MARRDPDDRPPEPCRRTSRYRSTALRMAAAKLRSTLSMKSSNECDSAEVPEPSGPSQIGCGPHALSHDCFHCRVRAGLKVLGNPWELHPRTVCSFTLGDPRRLRFHQRCPLSIESGRSSEHDFPTNDLPDCVSNCFRERGLQGHPCLPTLTIRILYDDSCHHININ